MEVIARAKSVRMSPKKAREVASLINGRSVADALVILEHTPRRAAGQISKVVNSAKANATNNHNMTEKSLVISSIAVTEGGSMRRWRPAARGRALPYRHRMSHIEVKVTGKVTPKKTADKATKKNDDKSDKPKTAAKSEDKAKATKEEK